jgi:hypothetical protein
MSKIAYAFAKYLVNEFPPLKITFDSSVHKISYPPFTVSNVNSINKCISYSNPLFNIKVENSKITLNYKLNNSYKNGENTLIDTPESFIKSILHKDCNYKNVFPAYENNINKHHFLTYSYIPIRYLHLYNDINGYFDINRCKIHIPSISDMDNKQKEILESIGDTPDNILMEIYKHAEYISTYKNPFKLTVNKSPNHYDYISNIWKTGDASVVSFSSVSALKFYKYTANAYSLNGGNYSGLYSSSGGIDMSYASTLPWFKLKKELGNSMQYYDLRGHNYYKSYDIGIVELIILSELLKREGFCITLEKI